MISGLHNIYLMNIFFLWYFCEYFCVLGIALGFQNSQYHIDTTAPVCLVSSVFSYPFLFFSMPLLAYSFIFSLFCFFYVVALSVYAHFVFEDRCAYICTNHHSHCLYLFFICEWIRVCVLVCVHENRHTCTIVQAWRSEDNLKCCLSLSTLFGSWFPFFVCCSSLCCQTSYGTLGFPMCTIVPSFMWDLGIWIWVSTLVS